ncbi:MAG: TerC family protein [Thiohalocapsa sp.]|jgi:predicted tellurium resistance membrane protein TerC|uniref:TerC family protein n=1 Tax=Thiohalocapsa sp. TaxID=2497641 RepID=UPI0025E5479C|nr:TerC family protein [Thiohalocapsa sp.]MCG6939668.1 TerC family protein [Thiohalocapsa sp.]
MLDWLFLPEAWLALVTLTALEIVLGIDNIVFISVLVGRLPPQQRDRARVQGLALAMVTRILLLLSLAWMMRLTAPLFMLLGQALSGRDLILIAGGLFLLWKSSQEIWDSLEGADVQGEHVTRPAVPGYWSVLGQIAVIDIVFSLDSVITAVGMAQHVPVMVIAIVLAVGVMMLAAKPIGDFVDAHPSIKMLALSFLILVGVALIGEGLDLHIPKGYIYFAMGFSVAVEMINIRLRKRLAAPVHLHRQGPGE